MSRNRALLAAFAAAKRAGWSAMEWVPPRVSSNSSDICSVVVEDDDNLRIEVTEGDDGEKAVAEEARSNDSSGAVASFMLGVGLGWMDADGVEKRYFIVMKRHAAKRRKFIVQKKQIFLCGGGFVDEGSQVGMKF